MESSSHNNSKRALKQVWNYIYNASYQLLVIASALVTTPFLARSLGPGALGIYGYIVSVAAIVQTITLLSLYTYGCRQIAYCRDTPSEVNRVFWELFYLRLLLGFIGSVIYFIFAELSQYKILFAIYYPWIIANIIDVTWLFIGHEDMKIVVFKNIVVKVLCVVCIFVFVGNGGGLLAYLIIMSVNTLLGNLAVYPQLKQYVGKPDVSPGFVFRDFKGALKLFIPEVTPTLTHRINHLTMGQVLNTEDDIAFYDQGEKIVNIPSSLVTAMNSVVMPRIANDHAQQRSRSVEEYVIWAGSAALMIAIPLSVGVASVAERLVPWFFGPGYDRVVPVIQLMSPVIVVDSLIGTIGSQFLTATDGARALNFSNGIGLVINVVLNLLLIPTTGCVGAVLSTVLARVTILVIQFLATYKSLDYIRIGQSALRYGAASFAMAITIAIVGKLVTGNIICTAIQIVVGCMTYTAILYGFRDPILRMLLKVLGHKEAVS